MADDNNEKKNLLTEEGFKELQEELSELTTHKRDEIAAKIAEAKAQGDLSENSEYTDALEQQAANEARIKAIETQLKNAEVISESDISTTRVNIGSKVTLRNESTKKEAEYTLVTPTEEDIVKHRLSNESPVGKAIEGKKKGQVAEVQTNAGIFKYKIIKIG